jgi:hypothetical protein
VAARLLPDAVAPDAKPSVFQAGASIAVWAVVAMAIMFLVPVASERLLNPAEFGTYKQIFLSKYSRLVQTQSFEYGLSFGGRE